MISREERRRRAIAEAGEVPPRARLERDEFLARAGGGGAGAAVVGAAAWPDDLHRAAEVAEMYLRWHQEERQMRAQGSAEMPS
jgi:hypothetical protein